MLIITIYNLFQLRINREDFTQLASSVTNVVFNVGLIRLIRSVPLVPLTRFNLSVVLPTLRELFWKNCKLSKCPLVIIIH